MLEGIVLWVGLLKPVVEIDMGTNPEPVELLGVLKALRNCVVASLLVRRNSELAVESLKLVWGWAVHEKMPLWCRKLDTWDNED